MNKNLYIHIGGHKTRSSAIQTHLKLNTKILNKNKILYLDGFKSELIKKGMNENLINQTKFFKNYF